jgi:hypothetical protein
MVACLIADGMAIPAVTSHEMTSQSTRSHASFEVPESFTPHPMLSLSGRASNLVLLVMFLFVDALVGRSGALLLKLLTHRAVELLFEDRLGIDGLELGLEVLHVVCRRVAATAGVGHVWSDVFDFVSRHTPSYECQ